MCSSKYEEEQLSAQSLKVKETSLSERELDLDEDEEIGMETVLPRRNARINIKEGSPKPSYPTRIQLVQSYDKRTSSTGNTNDRNLHL